MDRLIATPISALGGGIMKLSAHEYTGGLLIKLKGQSVCKTVNWIVSRLFADSPTKTYCKEGIRS